MKKLEDIMLGIEQKKRERLEKLIITALRQEEKELEFSEFLIAKNSEKKIAKLLEAEDKYYFAEDD